MGEVIGAVKPSRAIPAHAQALHIAFSVFYVTAGLKKHVLQQMRGAGLPSALVARADAVGDVDGCHWLGSVWHQQHLQAVGQRILADVFERAYGHKLGLSSPRARHQYEVQSEVFHAVTLNVGNSNVETAIQVGHLICGGSRFML